MLGRARAIRRLAACGLMASDALQKPGATIDTATNLKATQRLQQWIKAALLREGRQSHDTRR